MDNTLNNMKLSNIEMLRVLSIILIMFHHYALGLSDTSSGGITFNRVFFETLFCFSHIGVNCFVLITGFFSSNKEINYNRIVSLVFQTKIYALSLFVIAVLIKAQKASLNNIIQNLFPIITGRYWFVSIYILLYLLSPYINIVVESLTKKKMQVLIALLAIVVCFLPTLTLDFFYSRLLWFVLLFLCGRYYAIYKKELIKKVNPKKCLLYAIIVFVLLVLSVVVFDYIGCNISEEIGSKHYTFAVGNKVPQMVVSSLLFIYFENLKIQNNSLINFLSSCTFGIYLVHSGSGERIIWDHLFNASQYNNSVYMPIIVFGLVGLMLCIGIVVHVAYKKMENLLLKKAEQRLALKLERMTGK